MDRDTLRQGASHLRGQREAIASRQERCDDDACRKRRHGTEMTPRLHEDWIPTPLGIHRYEYNRYSRRAG